MGMKSIIFLLITLLVGVLFVAPQANAQSSLIRITGTVFCSLTGAPLLNTTTPTPAFASAVVQLTMLGIPIGAPVTTDSLGQFSIGLVPSVVTSITNLASGATVVVLTPLTACDSTLPPNSFLQSVSPLRLLSTTPIIHLAVGVFRLVRV
uniref:uncharacterized protein LOC122597455 n=1 Tax=Erigeron canadensis TaxID=72917 RepID=UPI001CB98D44|nr:uncharacterized protein LOC122597455 [Erigeron canadensis]